MNREIKFRQRNKNNGSFYYWGFVNGEWKQPIIQDNYHAPEESDQYTGLLDINGKEIYEGDICKRVCGMLYKVLWSEGMHGWRMYCLDKNYYYDVRDIGGHEWVVIGDIYSNPELLEVNND